MRGLFAGLVVLSFGGVAHALPTLDTLKREAARGIADNSEQTYPFNGAASLSGCSGALFRYDGQSMESRALVLTNGHCIGFLDPGEVIVNRATNRTVRFYDATDERTRRYDVRTIVYATMDATDMAVLELEATYQQINEESNVDPLILDTEAGIPGEEIAVVSGFWEYTTSCRLDGFVFSMEEGKWTWFDSLRFTQECVTFGGTSGSPVISVTTGKIVGVNNTGYEGGTACSLNNPCEVAEDGTVTTIADGSYGQQTRQLYGCIDEQFQLDLTRAGCELPKPATPPKP